MSHSHSIELREFERIDAAPGTALLRIAARSVRGVAPNRPPTLVIDDGWRLRRLAPLPAPPDPEGIMRAAYSVPASLIDGHRAAFALELPGGAIVDLPAPTRSSPRLAQRQSDEVESSARGAAATDGAELIEQRRLREEAERRAHARREAISELERRLVAEQDRRTVAEQRLAAATAARAELEQALRAAEGRVAELEGQLARAETVRANAEDTAARNDADSAAALERRVESLAGEVTSLRGELERTETKAREATRRADQEASAREAAAARINELEAERDRLEARERDERMARETVEALGPADAPPRRQPPAPLATDPSHVRQAAALGTPPARTLAHWPPLEAVLGLCLVVLGIIVAVLFLTGAVTLGGAT